MRQKDMQKQNEPEAESCTETERKRARESERVTENISLGAGNAGVLIAFYTPINNIYNTRATTI